MNANTKTTLWVTVLGVILWVATACYIFKTTSAHNPLGYELVITKVILLTIWGTVGLTFLAWVAYLYFRQLKQEEERTHLRDVEKLAKEERKLIRMDSNPPSNWSKMQLAEKILGQLAKLQKGELLTQDNSTALQKKLTDWLGKSLEQEFKQAEET